MNKIRISDLTLKQAAQNDSLSFREKVNIAKTVDGFGVNAIELPAIKSVREDTVINETIAKAVKNCALKIEAGTSEESINNAWESIKEAQRPCLQIMLPTSTVQMEYMYHMKEPKMLDMIKNLVSIAKSKCERVEFCALDATRADRKFLKNACVVANESGAVCVTLCDDAGIMMPDDFAQMFKEVKEVCDASINIQPSDKINMAAATAIKVVEAGADGIKTSLVGNEFLSTDVLANIIKIKGEDLKIESDLNVTDIHHKALALINGSDEIGNEPADNSMASDETVFTEESTLNDVCEACVNLGYELTPDDSGKVFNELQRVVRKKKSVGSKEFEAIIASTAMQVPSTYHLKSYVINSGNVITSTAHITLVKDETEISGVSTGDGPIDASFKTIEQIIGHHYELDDFQISALTHGREAVGSALVRLRADGKLYSGNGISTDIIGASIRAYVNALNKIVYGEN